MQTRDPELQILEQSASDLVFRIKNTEISYVNSLRRFIHAETKSLAFDYLEMSENTTCLPDEYIAHRVGLLPLKASDINVFKDPTECQCDGHCSECSVEFVFNSEFKPTDPQNNSTDFYTNNSETKMLTTDYLILSSDYSNTSYKAPPTVVKIAIEENEAIPICPIKQGQSLKFKVIARLGTGKMHSKFCPVSVCSYYIDRDVSINKRILETQDSEIITKFSKACPVRCRNVRDFIEEENEEQEYIEANDRKVKFYKYCEFCHRNARELNLNQILVIGKNKDEFVFNVESSGTVDAKEIVVDGLRLINDECHDLLNSIAEQT